jgi:hypothetical protein
MTKPGSDVNDGSPFLRVDRHLFRDARLHIHQPVPELGAAIPHPRNAMQLVDGVA